MTIDLNETIAYIHEQIPITAHMKTAITSYSGDALSIAAPLDANINHCSSAFGGSLSAVAILSGWALLHIKLKELQIETRLVIQKSAFEFLLPVTDAFTAISRMPSEGDYHRFLKIFNKKGMARIAIHSDVLCDNKLCGTHEGIYVALRDQ